jgi:hypothetical protein
MDAAIWHNVLPQRHLSRGGIVATANAIRRESVAILANPFGSWANNPQYDVTALRWSQLPRSRVAATFPIHEETEHD